MLRSPAKIIKQCLFHLDKCGLREMAVCYSQASYARDRLLSVLKRVKAGHCLQQQDRLQIKCLIEEAKLAIGHKIEQMQDDFRQFPDPDISERYDREADPEDSA